MMIEPITYAQQQLVIQRVSQLLLKCEQLFCHKFKPIDIRFDLSGRTSGMYVVRHKQKYFRFNSFIFAKYFNDGLETTVPHEVAHYVSDVIYGIKNIRPHGHEWKSIMCELGVEPKVTGNYDLAGIPVKRQRRFDYRCSCMSHQLSMTRHNKILKQKVRYHCHKCGDELAAFDAGELKISDWYVYILRCSDNSLYTGITNDLERRLNEHNNLKVGAKYTRARRPVVMVYHEVLASRSLASKRECKIKSLSKGAKEALLT